MNSTRIEVPLALPAPHFDDERTIATARQVKPIGRAKVTENWRRLRMLLPLIFLATFCGALGAASVNYYEDRRRVASIAPPVASQSTAEPKVEASPIVIATTTAPTPTVADKSSEAPAGQVKTEAAAPIEEPLTKTVTESAHDQPSEKAALAQGKKATELDATKLTRKRRVNPSDDDAVPASKKGAGRIVDIFSGPHPF